MTAEQTIQLFNKPTDWTYNDWLQSDAHYLLNNINKNVIEWIDVDDMSEQEKEENPTYSTTGGYLKVLDKSDCAQNWWDSLDDYDRNIIKALPNFDADIFKKCTGITI